MKKLILLSITLLLSSCSSGKSNLVKNDFKNMADLLCNLVSQSPEIDYKKYFDEKFVEAVPYKAIQSVFKLIYDDFGKCQSVMIDSKNGEEGIFYTKHKDKVDTRFLMTIKNKKIVGLLYKGKVAAPISFKSKDEIYKYISKNPHRMRLLFKKIGGAAVLEHNQKGGEALGSIFKLYILAALIEKINAGQLKWTQEFPIQERLKSLPSGRMQDLKAGTMISLEKFASQMISISDNTATDHLLDIVGRDYVESHMKKKRLNSYFKKTVPFLSTFEMFKTRAFFTKKDALKYKASSRQTRLKMIAGIPYKKREELLKMLGTWSEPRFNGEIEWFASANNICDLLDWSDKQKNPGFRKVIGLNTPFVDLKKSKRWQYAGYKGGSEPGVLEMSYLLEDKKGERWCLYMGQNSQTQNFDQSEFFVFVEAVLTFLEQ